MTPLHHVMQSGHDVKVQLFLEYWADPNAKDKHDSTPLLMAARGKNPLVAKLLLDSGADRKAKKSPEIHLLDDLSSPVFPIKINGNRFDESMKRAKDASTTNNIFVQRRGSLRVSARYRGRSWRRRSQALWLRIQNHILVLCTPPPVTGHRRAYFRDRTGPGDR